ncbi:MAG: hypothetical protein ACKO3N_14805 [Verrucomicrobiota bacterium]
MLLPALSKAKLKATLASCLNNQKQLAVGSKLYSLDTEWIWDRFRHRDRRPIQ